ncbi:hypothetical protein P3S68_006280 [Capsicum galapagoense]
MRGSGALVSLLALALFLLLKVSANPSHPFHLPANETILGHLELAEGEEQCGNRDGDKKCPCRECCSIWGFCGTGPEYCDRQTCQSQCEVPAATGKRGIQGGGEKHSMRGIQSFFLNAL